MRKFNLFILIFCNALFSFAQTITDVSPNYGAKGQTLNVTITGNNTHFTQPSATTVTFFKSGSPTSAVNVNHFSSSSSTTIIANISISPGAANGLYDIVIYDFADGIIGSTFSVVNVGIQNVNESENAFEIYPNPVKEYFFIEIKDKNSEIEQITILDLPGRKVFEQLKPVLQNGLLKLDANQMQLHSGTYIINVRTTGGNYYRKILVE
ncbi:MAG: T9SS type A sorting domain-containing protein [Bacteroidia bacterium]